MTVHVPKSKKLTKRTAFGAAARFIAELARILHCDSKGAEW